MFLMKLIYSDGSFLRLPTAVQHSSKKEFTWAAQLMNWQLSLYYLLYLLLNCHRHVSLLQMWRWQKGRMIRNSAGHPHDCCTFQRGRIWTLFLRDTGKGEETVVVAIFATGPVPSNDSPH